MGKRGRIPLASDIIVEAIRSRILAQRLPEGFRLPSESELMEEYGLGRVTVRQAIRILEADGLVDVRRGPSGGVFVRHADIQQVGEAFTLLFGFQETRLRDFLEFRNLLEPRVASLAAVHASEEQKAEILRVGSKSFDHTGGSADFHTLIAKSSGNDVISFGFEALHLSFVRHIRRGRVGVEDAEGTRRAHTRIAQLIADGDAEGAAKAMATHLAAYEEYLRANGLIDEPIVPREPWGTAH